MSFSAERTALADSLKAAGRVVYAYPKEVLTPPAIVLVPGSPYLEAQAIGPLGTRAQINFDLTILVNASDNQAALAKLEDLMIAVWGALPTGYYIDTWGQPQIDEVSGNQMLTANCRVSTVTQIGN